MYLFQGAGKTTFTNLLLDPEYKVKQGKGESTLGISIHRDKEFAHSNKEMPNIKTNIWDFGGQDIQKMLHQFFITEECLYVLISDKRAENTNFDYWFQIINMLGPKSSVIVVENPKEAIGNNEDFPLNKYQRLYPDLDIQSIEVNFKNTRTRDKEKWTILNQLITEKLSCLEVVNRMVPKRWGMVRNYLVSQKKKKYITIETFYELCAKPEIGFNRRQADWCLSYFRSLGDLVYFDDRDLCTHIFLDQNWLTKGLYYILSDTSIKQKGGRFSQKQAFEKWEGNGYSKTEKAMLTKLLLKDKFDICYELPNEKDIFITPLLLTSDAPSLIWKHQTNLQFRFEYGFIPHGLFSRLIVQLHEKIDKEQPWKTGVRLKDIIYDVPVYAEVQQFNDPKENQRVIDIRISGEKTGCKEMLAFIRNALDKLHKDFRNILVKQKVACNCDYCVKRMKQEEKPSFYDYDMLCDKVMHHRYFVDCEASKWKPVNIGQILSDVIIENAAIENKDCQLFTQLKESGMSINKITNIANGGNATSTSSSTSSSQSTATNAVTITINNMLGEVQNLKEDFEDDKKLLIKNLDEDNYDATLRDIGKAEKAVEEIGEAQNKNEGLPAKSTSRLKSFMDDLSNEKSTLHKGLKIMRKGRDYGVKIAELYNKVAENAGLPSLPPLTLKVIKAL